MRALPVNRVADGKGRVALGKEFAGRLVIIRRPEEGTVEITLAEAIPAKEVWLYRNKAALQAVIEGIEDAKAGRLTDGPDLKLGADLAETIKD